MQRRKISLHSVLTATIILALSSVVWAQQHMDSTVVDPQHHKVVFENDQVRVVRYVIPAGETSQKHSHPDNVAIYLTDVSAKVTNADGKTVDAHAKEKTAAWRPATTHVFQNVGEKPIEGLLIEPKSPHSARPAGSVDETTLPTDHSKVEFENDKVRVVHYRFEPGQMVPMHGHPDNVQIALTDATAKSTGPDGKTTDVSLKAGEVKWRPAFQHSVLNTGSAPIEGYVVEMKGAPTTASN